MGNGLPRITDEGTSARIDHPPPGPVGLDARGGGNRPANLGEQVAAFSRRHRGQRVGDGECFALADRALRSAGAQSAADYGSVSPDADYVWGSAVGLRDLQPGDVVQFRDYRYEKEVETRHPDGSAETTEEVQERPHHTAVVESVGANGEVTVLEQNSPEGSPVTRATLYFSGRNDATSDRTTRIQVQGRFWFYRPQPR